MRVMIVGANGQVGRALVAAAPPGITDLVALTHTDLDITDLDMILRQVTKGRADLLINAAAYTDVEGAECSAWDAFAVNATGPGFLADAAARAGIGLVHISTDFVFDGTSTRPYRPGDALAPINVYGASKAAGELEIQRRLPEALIVRTAWVYAADGRNFVNTMLRLLNERDVVSVVSDQIGTPTHADSLARGLWRLVEMRPRGIFHMTDTGSASWYEFAVAIQQEAIAAGLLERRARIEPISSEQFPTRAKRPAFSVLDCRGTWDCIGEAARDWREELHLMLAELGKRMAA